MQFSDARSRYKRYGVVGRTVAFIGQLLLAAITAAGAWGLFMCLTDISSLGMAAITIIIPIVLIMLSAGALIVGGMWTILFVIAYVPVLIGEIRKHNKTKKQIAEGSLPDYGEADVPRMSKAADIVFIVLNFLPLLLAVGGAIILLSFI